MTIVEKLKKMLQEKAPTVELSTITMETDIKSLGIDSLDFVELIYQIETDFDIEVPAEALSEINTVQNLVDIVEQSIVRV